MPFHVRRARGGLCFCIYCIIYTIRSCTLHVVVSRYVSLQSYEELCGRMNSTFTTSLDRIASGGRQQYHVQLTRQFSLSFSAYWQYGSLDLFAPRYRCHVCSFMYLFVRTLPGFELIYALPYYIHRYFGTFHTLMSTCCFLGCSLCLGVRGTTCWL